MIKHNTFKNSNKTIIHNSFTVCPFSSSSSSSLSRSLFLSPLSPNLFPPPPPSLSLYDRCFVNRYVFSCFLNCTCIVSDGHAQKHVDADADGGAQADGGELQRGQTAAEAGEGVLLAHQLLPPGPSPHAAQSVPALHHCPSVVQQHVQPSSVSVQQATARASFVSI